MCDLDGEREVLRDFVIIFEGDIYDIDVEIFEDGAARGEYADGIFYGDGK